MDDVRTALSLVTGMLLLAFLGTWALTLIILADQNRNSHNLH
jgi:hypothetical protein